MSSIEECLSLCEQETEFKCKSIQYYALMYCRLNIETHETLPDKWMENRGMVYCIMPGKL